MNKKAAYPSIISMPIAIVLLVLVMFVFGIIFIILSVDLKVIIKENAFLPSEDLKLLNYLKTPLNYNQEKITFGDLIILADKDKTNINLLRESIYDFSLRSSQLYQKKGIEYITIFFTDGTSENYLDDPAFSQDDLISELNLPSQDPLKQIKVQLYFGERTFKELPQYTPPPVSPGFGVLPPSSPIA